jgi:hypothetical protein
MPCRAVLRGAVLCCAVLYCVGGVTGPSVPMYRVLSVCVCYDMPCLAVPCCAVLCCAVLCWRGDGSFRPYVYRCVSSRELACAGTVERTQPVTTLRDGAGSLLVAASCAVVLVCSIALSD